ncbi:putative cysteine desulfurase [Candidatus Clavichlamydia salmonicola]|uniref:SufS family cysteine desulfurase n=1 Tax=Candidatus Clavichlamydia salmonicola TaxID=469812 RepID=UPI0018911D11|nr:SufS family cysteine desulfurase [Candidatus Clavichlamydia salmonicola]MBF5050720.1 putative cysteine desulfurase [Candidatus Clavichlamydia salmonicola]
MVNLMTDAEEEIFTAIKAEFPIFTRKIEGNDLIYLDTAATAQKPKAVISAITDFYSYGCGTVHRGVYALSRSATKQFIEARERIAAFFHVLPEEILFTRGATSALNNIARALSMSALKEGDVILLSSIEHHACEVSWRIIAKQYGLIIKYIPVDDQGNLIIEEAERLIKAGARVINLVHIANVYGAIIPVDQIIDIAHKHDVLVILDGTQSAAHFPLDLKKMNVDVFVASGHKMYGPTGIGISYIKKELLDHLPPFEGGGDMVETVTEDELIFHPAPLKFEAGTPAIASVIGLGEACHFLMNIGMNKVFLREREITSYSIEKFLAMDQVEILGNKDAFARGSLVSFAVKGIHPLDIAYLLDAQGIAIRSGNHCSQSSMRRSGYTSLARISFGVYTLKSDIDYFSQVLEEIITLLSK